MIEATTSDPRNRGEDAAPTDRPAHLSLGAGDHAQTFVGYPADPILGDSAMHLKQERIMPEAFSNGGIRTRLRVPRLQRGDSNSNHLPSHRREVVD